MSIQAARLPSGFNYRFRPTSYFQDLERQTLILSSILGEERRKDVQARLAAGDFDPAVWGEWLTESQLDDATRTLLGQVHPAFMGGEYLPALGEDEIEIVRIVLASVTQDVISVRARRCGKRIVYRVVDEYEASFKLARKWSAQALTLRELIGFIDGTEQEDDECGGGLVLSVLKGNIDYGCAAPESMRGFVRVTSQFYPQLQAYYVAATDLHLDGLAVEEDPVDEDFP